MLKKIRSEALNYLDKDKNDLKDIIKNDRFEKYLYRQRQSRKELMLYSFQRNWRINNNTTIHGTENTQEFKLQKSSFPVFQLLPPFIFIEN